FTIDPHRIERTLEQLSETSPDMPMLRKILQSSLGELNRGGLPVISLLIRLLDELVLKARFRPDINLLLFRKSLFTLDGVLSDLSHLKQEARDTMLDQTVLASFIEHWIHEWPRRFFAFFDDRSFSTHLSNADLFRLMWSAPTNWLVR